MTVRRHLQCLCRVAGLVAALGASGCAAPEALRTPSGADTSAPVRTSAFAADTVADESPAQRSEAVATPEPATPAPSKAPTFKLRGRIEADAITVSQSEKSKAIYGDFQNVVGFRRARLGAEGTAGEQANWVAEFDFAGGNVAFKNVFVAVNHLPVVGEVRVGHFLEPFSLEGQTPSTVFPFAERSPGAALDPARNWGVGFFSHTTDERVVVQAGAFRSGTDNTGTDAGDGNDMAFTGRVTGLPWLDETGDSPRLLHVGGAISQRYAKNDTVTFNHGLQSSLLQSNTDNPLSPFVSNITIAATQNQLFNVQSALLLGPLLVQAEWTGTRIDQIVGGAVFFQGAYILASYFLTGESRTYNRPYGTFGGPHVKSPFVCTDGPGRVGAGPGAWEVTARLAWLDLDDPNVPPAPNGLRVGGRLTTLTLGLNWYLTDNAQLMLNYVHAVPTDPNFGSSTADTVTIRTAVFW
jgi:phosphate-selective porin OprO and OprP